MYAQGFVGVGRAGGEEAALPAYEKRQAVTIDPDQGAEEKVHEIMLASVWSRVHVEAFPMTKSIEKQGGSHD